MKLNEKNRYIDIEYDNTIKFDIIDYLDDIEKFILDNKNHPDIKDFFDNCGYIAKENTTFYNIIKAISDYEYCHQDKNILIEEIKQVVQYKNYKHDDYRGA